MTETNFTTEQLEAWAGLGPWCALGTDPAEGVDCFWIKGQPNPAMRGFSDEIASVNGSQNDPKRQTNAALIAAAPALAAVLLAERKAREVEVANLRKEIQIVIDDCEADYPPSHGAIKYGLKQALKGPTP